MAFLASFFMIVHIQKKNENGNAACEESLGGISAGRIDSSSQRVLSIGNDLWAVCKEASGMVDNGRDTCARVLDPGDAVASWLQ